MSKALESLDMDDIMATKGAVEWRVVRRGAWFTHHNEISDENSKPPAPDGDGAPNLVVHAIQKHEEAGGIVGGSGTAGLCDSARSLIMLSPAYADVLQYLEEDRGWVGGSLGKDSKEPLSKQARSTRAGLLTKFSTCLFPSTLRPFMISTNSVGSKFTG